MRACSVLTLVVVLLGVKAGDSFKDQEFKTCDMNPFCKRNRHRESGAAAYDVQTPGFIKGTGAKQHTAMALLAERTTGETFTLELKAYRQGVVRVTLHEADKAVQRYSVPDVLEPNLETLQAAWESIVPEGRSGPTRLTMGTTVVLVQHSPFALTMTVNGAEVLAFNDRQLLHMEHQHTTRQVNDTDDMWATKFKSHSETIRHGPTSLMWDASFPGAAAVYGIPEHATSMALRPTMGEGIKSEPYRLFNLDVFEYLHESPFGLYGSIPFLMAHGPRGATGLFWLNAAEMYVDVSTESAHPHTQWIAETGKLDLFIMIGPTPAEVTTQYSTLTGNTYLPPLFSIGYHQCRWNYRDQPDVVAVDAGFDENVMPYDVLWLDIEHTDGKRYFTWDKRLFPEPAKMQNALAKNTRKMVNIVDPHIKRDNQYYVHKEATSQGLYVKDAAGKDYEGWCWPGSSSYLDFTSPKVRDFWASKFALDSYEGSTSSLYIWNDMNEPSVFNGPEITMPKDIVHHNNWEHRDVHNLYGYYLHMATSQGLQERGDANMRPFVLSRAFFSGTQRVGPIWTGDNAADWDHLRVSLPMLLTLGLSGLTFSGADVGGFFGNPDAELMVRWYQVGAFYPFFRGHAHQETKRREPWLFGEPHTGHIRDALRLRYNLLPYIYTQFAEAAEANVPVMRPLFMEFPDDASLYTKEDAFLVGPALLVAPVLSKGQRSVAAQLPGQGVWYRLSTGEKHASPATVTVATSDWAQSAVFVRGGFVVPRRERPRRSSSAQAGDPYTLLVALNASGAAEGHLYEDDGLTTAHQQGAFVFRTFTFADGTLRSTARKQPTGRAIYTSTTQVERIVILGLPSLPTSVTVQGDGRKLDAALGTVAPADVAHPSDPTSAVVLRRPQLAMAADWALTFQL